MIADLQIKKIYWCGCFYFNGSCRGKGKGSGQICFHYINRFVHYITMVDNFPYLDEIFRDLMFLIFHFTSFIFRDLNKNSKGKRPANLPRHGKKGNRQRKEESNKTGSYTILTHPILILCTSLSLFPSPHTHTHTHTPTPTQTPKKNGVC